MSQSHPTQKTAPRPSIVADLSACFRYPISDDTSVISDFEEIKKISQEKKASKVQMLNNVGEDQQVSCENTMSLATNVSTNFHPYACNCNDPGTPITFTSDNTFISEQQRQVCTLTMKKVNFASFEKTTVGASLLICKKDVVESTTGHLSAPQSAHELKRVNFMSVSSTPLEEDVLQFEDEVLGRNLRIFRKGIFKQKLKRALAGHPDSTGMSPHQQKPDKCCNCKSSKCLKLYCECFKAKGYCGEACKCIDCGNRKPANLDDTVTSNHHSITPNNNSTADILSQNKGDSIPRTEPENSHVRNKSLVEKSVFAKEKGNDVDFVRRAAPTHCHCFSNECACEKNREIVLGFGLYDFQNES
jgi:hypothetical protein